MNSQEAAALDSARVSTLKRVSDALGNDLSRSEVDIVVRLCEKGVNPEGLALALKEIQQARAAGKR